MIVKSPIEIERKFLVATMPQLQDLEAFQVRQGYLTAAVDTVEIRLRQKREVCFLTLKSGAGLQRLEHEILIDRSQFDALWPATEGRRIEKIRYVGHLNDQQVFELDVFSDRLASLVLVEVEFPSLEAATAFISPEWFGVEVTDDKRFKNGALAMNGLPASMG
jgi:CYTH domain-containing protein